MPFNISPAAVSSFTDASLNIGQQPMIKVIRASMFDIETMTQDEQSQATVDINQTLDVLQGTPGLNFYNGADQLISNLKYLTTYNSRRRVDSWDPFIHALDLITYYYRIIDTRSMKEPISTLKELSDIVSITNEYKALEKRMSKVELNFLPWTGETSTWFAFSLDVEATMTGAGFETLLTHDPTDRNQVNRHIAIAMVDAKFYAALYRALHAAEKKPKLTRLDFFYDSRRENRSSLRGSVVFDSMSKTFNSPRAIDERFQLLKEALSSSALSKNDPFHMDSVPGENIATLVSLLPLMKPGTDHTESNQAAKLNDAFDIQAIRNHNPTDLQSMRTVRTDVGGLPHSKKLDLDSLKRPTVSKTIRRTQNGAKGQAPWPLGHKEQEESNKQSNPKVTVDPNTDKPNNRKRKREDPTEKTKNPLKPILKKGQSTATKVTKDRVHPKLSESPESKTTGTRSTHPAGQKKKQGKKGVDGKPADNNDANKGSQIVSKTQLKKQAFKKARKLSKKTKKAAAAKARRAAAEVNESDDNHLF